jgi:hypothetical protein
VITGYNTDVEYDGVVYHVQTEDKGVQTPIILSLVYVGGAILASKRAPYNDLIASGFDKQILTERLQRQHKLICAAVHAGRIEELKRMNEREPSAFVSAPPVEKLTNAEPVTERERPSAPPSTQTEDYARDVPLAIKLIEEPEFRGGGAITLKALVTKATLSGRAAAANVKLVVKILSTAFSPSKVETMTDGDGLATVSLKFPKFRSGRAAVLVQAEDGGMRAELRRIILPS